mmetsp:Transcript_12675/g.48598  ORF Transcript_12675/g.48598 Transcript_12675/m.48598 type:complete len:239 (-) Transcript_12675:1494-2210(-)
MGQHIHCLGWKSEAREIEEQAERHRAERELREPEALASAGRKRGRGRGARASQDRARGSNDPSARGLKAEHWAHSSASATVHHCPEGPSSTRGPRAARPETDPVGAGRPFAMGRSSGLWAVRGKDDPSTTKVRVRGAPPEAARGLAEALAAAARSARLAAVALSSAAVGGGAMPRALSDSSRAASARSSSASSSSSSALASWALAPAGGLPAVEGSAPGAAEAAVRRAAAASGIVAPR